MKGQNKIIVFCIFTLIFPIFFPYVGNTKIDDVLSCIKEIAYSYYMRGQYIQANSAKDHFFSPEEATSQNINYFVSTGFTTSIYQELLNIVIPIWPAQLLDYAVNNLGNPEVFAYADVNGDNLEMKIYDPNSENKLQIKNNPGIEDIFPLLKVGDILASDSHAFLIYDLIKSEDKVNDAIIIESLFGDNYRHIKTKITDIRLQNGELFSSIGFTPFWNYYLNLNLEEGLVEGSIRIRYLSKDYYWRNIKTLRGPKYAIFRFINSNANQDAILNYKNIYSYWKPDYNDNDLIELSNKNKDRIRFKHLFIDKTVDKINNNIVEVGDSLVYTIVVKNMGKADYTDDLIVTENLSPFVKYKKRKESKKVASFKEDKDNRQLIWNLGKLKKKEEYTIIYTVEVSSGNSRDIIESKGFVANIPSALVYNTIGKNLKKEQMNSIKSSYDKLKKKFDGKKLINEIYKKAFNIDIELDKFNITDLILTNNISSISAYTSYLNAENPFYKAILNKYWSMMATTNYSFTTNGEEVPVYSIKDFFYFLANETSIKTEDYIYKETFMTGDILIYINNFDIEYSEENGELFKKNVTNENGEYAYVYIEGNGFVGVNFGGDGKPNTIDDRNEFNFNYYKANNLSLYKNDRGFSEETSETDNIQTLLYKDYYVILRPSLCFDFPNVQGSNKSSTSVGLIIFIIILIVAVVIIGGWFLLKFLRKKQQSKGIDSKVEPIMN